MLDWLQTCSNKPQQAVRCTRAIRKELPNDCGSARELEIHSQLNQRNHPNILPLFGSYTYDGRLNLILPAMEYRLSDLWVDDDEDAAKDYFPSEATYFDAMSGLSSAISSLHGFKRQAIGCHHDLKPNNILLKEKNLILADYGLTTFKQPLEYSKSATSRFDPYLAPEGIDSPHGTGQHKVGRASDIYSLACIFTELLVFMVWGKVGVDEFYDDRAKTSNLGRSSASFYDYKSRNPCKAVLVRLERIRSMSLQKGRLVDLLREMLLWDPESRPKAETVYNTIKKICETFPDEPADSAVPLPKSTDITPISSVHENRVRLKRESQI